MYYLRTQAARDAIKFTVQKPADVPVENKEEGDVASKDEEIKNEVVKTDEDKEREKYGGFTRAEMLDKMKVIDDDDPSMCISCGA